MLEPDREQLEIFVDAMFRHAGDKGWVSFRSFFEGNGAKPFRLSPTSLAGGFKFLVDVAEDDARRAANDPKAVVFCPPLAVFGNKDRAREEDLLCGLVLSVECDQHPLSARGRLEEILGPATIVVSSGGTWADSATGQPQPKLHLHWRLSSPARDKGSLSKLKLARQLAAGIVGGDPSNKPICHPIRWPGSWHRKGEPVLCCIEGQDPDREIDIDAALAALTAASGYRETRGNGQDRISDVPDDEWNALVESIISGRSYHEPLVKLAARLIGSGNHDGSTVKLLRGLMDASVGPKDDRWQARFDDIPRTVATAREKYEPTSNQQQRKADKPPPPMPNSAEELNRMTFDPIKYVVPGYIVEGLTLFAGKPKLGKSWLLLHAAIAVARSGFTLGDVHCQEGDVLYCALEDNLRRLRSRLEKLMQTQVGWPKRLNFFCEMPRLAEGGLDQIREWLEQAECPRLVVIDTLAMVRMPNRKDQSTYDADYSAVKDLRALAHQYNVAIVLVHHLRKAEGDDVFDTISGTLGLTGCPDTIMVIRRDSTSGTTLHARGRDLPDIEKAVKFDLETCVWTVLGNAGTVRQSDQRATIVEAMTEAGDEPLGPNQIAAITGMKSANVRYLLGRMKSDGIVRKAARGKYTLHPSQLTNAPHNTN
jgi:hypothetical protein